MKYYIALIFSVGLFFCSFSIGYDDTNDFIILKNYDLQISKETVNHPINFSKGNYYKLALDEKTAPIKIQILDNHKRMVGTNHDIRTGKFYDAMIFKCQTTGDYTVQFGSEEKSCEAKCIVSFKVI